MNTEMKTWGTYGKRGDGRKWKKMCVQRQLDCIRCGCGGVAGDIKKWFMLRIRFIDPPSTTAIFVRAKKLTVFMANIYL